MSEEAREMTAIRTPHAQLFTMMLLQIFIWGACLPLIFGYLPTLGFSPSEQSWILSAFPVAAIIGLFFSNQFADRNIAAEKFLSFSLLVGGLSMFGLTMTTEFWPFLILMWVHCLFYVPTISITHSIAFAHMKDPASEFGPIRMGGHHRLDTCCLGSAVFWFHLVRLASNSGNDTRAKVVERSLMA